MGHIFKLVQQLFRAVMLCPYLICVGHGYVGWVDVRVLLMPEPRMFRTFLWFYLPSITATYMPHSTVSKTLLWNHSQTMLCLIYPVKHSTCFVTDDYGKNYFTRTGMGKVGEASYQIYVALLLCFLEPSCYTWPETSREVHLSKVCYLFVPYPFPFLTLRF